MHLRGFFRILGPGLLYAGAAVGVSHLVQSTRAGAGYGFELLWILILANALKYPFFEFGARYSAATGLSLIEGYRRIGKWAVVVFTMLTIATMFSIQAAVTIVTAGLIGNVFNLAMSSVQISGIILFMTAAILMIGRFSILDKLIKFVIVLLALSTIIAVIFALGKGWESDQTTSIGFDWTKRYDLFFLIAFIGWMPAPIDISVWQSLWTNAKYRQLGTRPRLKEVLLDFKIGYIGTALLAACFMTLGALVLHGSGEQLSPEGAIFAGQFIRLYTGSIGPWAYWVIAIAAITTMFSTVLTCLDAYPRVMKPLTSMIIPPPTNSKKGFNISTFIWIAIVITGTLLLMTILHSTMQTMVDIATTLSFVTAPLLAILNYRVVTDKHMPLPDRPKLWLRVYSWLGIVFLSGFMVFYVVWKFVG
jgi:Mn2+/Fe2+ NRAMP family transporter